MPRKKKVIANVQSELGLLGALLTGIHQFDSVQGRLRADFFSVTLHQQIYTAMKDLIEEGKSLSMVALLSRLPDEDEEKGAVPVYVASLVNGSVGLGASDFIDDVAEAAHRRQTIAIAEEMIKGAKDDKKKIGDITASASEAILDIAQSKTASHIELIGEVARRANQMTSDVLSGQATGGYVSGIRAIDSSAGRLMPGDLVTILGRSGHGKTSLAMQIMMNSAAPSLDEKSRSIGLFLSMEMTSLQIARRALSTETGIPTKSQRSGSINPAEFDMLRDAERVFEDYPVYIDGSGRQTMTQIRDKARMMKRLHGIKMMGVDHVKLIKTTNPRWTDIDVISNAAMALKDLAKELDIVILLLAQPTRKSQEREESWRVRDQDIYGGDAVKQSSEIVMSVSLPRKWLKQMEPSQSEGEEWTKWRAEFDRWAGLGEFAVLKNRDDEDGDWVKLAFDGARVKFGDIQK